MARALRNEGYNVIAIAEVTPAADDEDIIGLAYSEAKILLTEDYADIHLILPQVKNFLQKRN